MNFARNSDFRVSRIDGDFLAGEEEEEVQTKSEESDSNNSDDSENEEGEGVDDDDLRNSEIDSGMESDELDPSGLGEPGTELCQVGNQSCCMPVELYDLNGLGPVLSLETWNECLSEEERFKLTEFLPDMDQETFGRTLAELFAGSSFHFCSPLVTLFDMLKGGLCDPSVMLRRRGLRFFQRQEYYHRLYGYHSGLVRSLVWIGNAWRNCAGYDVEDKIQMVNAWRDRMPLDDRRVGDSGSETDVESGDSSRYLSKRFKVDRDSAKRSHDEMYQISKGFLKVNAPNVSVQDFAGKSSRYSSSFQHGSGTKRKHETPPLPFSQRDQVASYSTGAAAMKARHGTISDLNDTVDNRYEMGQGDWIAGPRNAFSRNSLLNTKKKKAQHKYDRDVEDSEHTEKYAASSYHQGKRKFVDKAASVAAYSNTSLSSSKKSKHPNNYWADNARDRVEISVLRETLFQRSAGSQPMKHSKMHQDVSFLDHSVKSSNGDGKGKKWRSQYEYGTSRNSAGYDMKPKPHKAIAGLDGSYNQTDIQPRASNRKLKNSSIQHDLVGADYSRNDIMYAQSEETESDSSDEIKHEDVSHGRKLGHYRGEVEGYQSGSLKSEFEPNKVNKARKMFGNNYSYYPDGGTDLYTSEVEAYSTKSKKKGKQNESNYLHDNMMERGSVSYASHNLHNASSRSYNTEKRRRAMVDLDRRPQQLFARDYDYNGSLLDDYMENAEESPELQGSTTQSKRIRSRMAVSDAQALKFIPHEMSSMPLTGCSSVIKKSKKKVDGQYPNSLDESMYLTRQFDNPNTIKKKGKRKSDAGLDALAAVISDSLVPEKGMADVEPELKPQKKPFILITPTIHTGFSFSIVHLLTAVRKAMTTPNMDDVVMVGSHLDKTDNEPKQKMVDTETHQTTNVTHSAEPAANNHFPSRTVQEIVDRVKSNPGDPCILETQEPLQDLVRGTLRMFSSRTAPLGAKNWKPLVSYESSNKSWSWIGPAPTSSPDNDVPDEENSPEAWGVPHKMLVKLVDAFANWLKSGQDTLKQIGSLTAPPASLFINLDEKERFKDLRAQKSLNTIAQSSEEIRAYFRKEELLRYSIPDRAFSYTAADGKKSIVAPLRRGGGKPTSKARDHFMLKADRPPHVTILCLVRDAAARLPGSIGTRADVCTLIRDSQYIVETVTDAQVNQVVSGALDRLHYERDPCVQFDSEKKIWKYLHRDREEEDFEDDGTSSTKKWKRQKKDNADQPEGGALNEAGPVIGDTAANASSTGLDDEHDLNIDVLSSKAVEETGQIHDKRSPGAEDVDSFLDGSKDERSHWGELRLNPFQETGVVCQENNTIEDYDYETFGMKRVLFSSTNFL